ncbi:MAG: rhodanese-like domain-containing protein [Patescibacteria group bacterium]
MKLHAATTNLFLLAIIGGLVGGLTVLHLTQGTTTNPIATYYQSAAATLVSPHHLRKEMDLGHDHFILVDLRTQAEYEEEHIVGAINIDASQPKEDLVAAFAELETLDKQIIIYCYSAACMTGRKVGAALSEEGIYVQELTIGWNEWRYDFNSWNYPNEWDQLDPNRYIVSGSEPGELAPIAEGELPPPCRIDGELGC